MKENLELDSLLFSLFFDLLFKKYRAKSIKEKGEKGDSLLLEPLLYSFLF